MINQKEYYKLEMIEELPALSTVKTSKNIKVLSIVIFLIFLSFILIVIYMPWLQTVPGIGKVIAYAPLERQQNIEAPVEGRIIKWYVKEGSKVKKGSTFLMSFDSGTMRLVNPPVAIILLDPEEISTMPTFVLVSEPAS